MIRSKKTFYIICALTFLTFTAHALTIYIQSSYLEQYASVQYVGLYITIATSLNLLAIFLFPQFIKKFSNYKVALAVSLVYIINTFFLISSRHPLTVLIFFVVYFVTITLIGINLDIFLEDISKKQNTGKIRTLYLTVVNTAILIGPLSVGFLLNNTDRYYLAFALSGALIFVTLVGMVWYQKYLSDHIVYNRRHMVELFGILRKNKSMSHIFILSFVLRFFYGVMVIYTPLYFHRYMGFTWETIGIMFTIMLLPFVFLELPAGHIADKYLGEKEMMIAGMIIMAIFTGMMTFISSTSVILWTSVLFMTRIGAALVEAMQEVYFFKIIKREDVDIINLFRDMTPLGWLCASISAVVILKFLPLQYLFLFLALVILASLYSAFRIKDTK